MRFTFIITNTANTILNLIQFNFLYMLRNHRPATISAPHSLSASLFEDL
jgi:hypothetical protein